MSVAKIDPNIRDSIPEQIFKNYQKRNTLQKKYRIDLVPNVLYNP